MQRKDLDAAMSDEAASISSALDDNSGSWIELTEPKQFSRLLYTNPVCFLSTVDGAAAHYLDRGTTAKSIEDDVSRDSRHVEENAERTPMENPRKRPKRNVMVLSWLTATNNSGRFMFSINKRRHTASILVDTENTSRREFVLSVPVRGMESLVRNAGHASGKWGSKFPDDHEQSPGDDNHQTDITISKRKRKKQNQFSRGVPGLKAVPVGHKADSNSSSGSSLFAIEGTVSHLVCQTYHVIKDDLIDEEHFLVLAQVTGAYVHRSYWDANKNLFRPQAESPPYLTFFGSQTFGYTVAH